ncbi:MAG: tRNA (pseudouridine(54)-N(1))-methyltransferase TrmY [Thermoplasmata archaeon]|nr:tRNA (pseudouridine(54)-N(1))-methyltransferase TrmY [Thermoplasmata archaeon]
MVRELLLLVHAVPTDGGFTLNDLAGGGGRMDEVARVVSNALTISNGLRRDVRVRLLFHGATPAEDRQIQVDGSRVRYLNPDERSTAALLKNALVRSVAASAAVESSPGLTVERRPVLEELRSFLQRPGVLWLTEGGSPLRSWAGNGDVAAVLSDPKDPTPEERLLLESNPATRCSVGPHSLRSSQVVDLLWNELDLREATGTNPTSGSV